MIWLWIIFVGIAAILNAVMDSIENEHVYATIFKNKNPAFWHKRYSWDKAKKIGGWKFDAWHVAKSLMIFSLCAAVVFYKQIWNPLIDYSIAGGTWIITFNLFYNRVFKIV
jgi:hypothetical protein